MDFLPSVLLILGAAILVVAIFKKLHLSPVLGYFVSGALIGSYGLGIVSADDTRVFAEFGVVFLLFAIGLELTFERLMAMRRYVLGVGTSQVILTALALGGLIYCLGAKPPIALIIGGGLALSSTAVVLQVLAENRMQSTQTGRIALAILLLQDFTVVPLLVLVPLLADDGVNVSEVLTDALFKAIVSMLGIFVIGRVLLRPLFRMISSSNTARTNELFIATTLLIALGSAWTTEHFGLSLAMGAFLAGLLVAETEYQHQVEDSIAPFKGLFLGLFFMTVGMSINLNIMIEKWATIALFSLGLVTMKAIIIFLLCLLFGFSRGVAIHTGLLLAQGGEFAFVLFGLAVNKHILDKEFGQILLLVVTLTMAFTPLLSAIGQWFSERSKKSHVPIKENISKENADLDNHVIIAGFGRVGRMVAKVLEEEEIHYVAIDQNKMKVVQARKDGFPVFHGTSSSLEMLQSVGVERAKSFIITIDHEGALKKTLSTLSRYYPELPVVVRSNDLMNAQELLELGATTIVPETYETGLQLGGAVLKSVGISDAEVSRLKNQFRAGNYVLARRAEDAVVNPS